jgi:hypothetical protein
VAERSAQAVQRLRGSADDNEVRLLSASNIGQGVGRVAALGDEAELDAKFVGAVSGIAFQLVGDFLTGLLDSGVVIGHSEPGRRRCGPMHAAAA